MLWRRIRSALMADVGDLIYAVLRDRTGLGVSPSNGWLTSMVLAAVDPRDETTESEVLRAVTKAVKAGGIPGVLDLGRVSGLEGRPQVLAIHPEHGGPADPEGLIKSRVEGLGSSGVRRAMLEDRLIDELRSREFWVMSFPRRFHKVSADFAVRGEDGQQWNVECRNLRWATTTRLHPRDRSVMQSARLGGARTLFIVPKATWRFRREVAELDGIVLETGVYLVPSADQVDALVEIGLPWEVAPSVDAISGVADEVVDVVGPLIQRAADDDSEQPLSAARELRRLRKQQEYWDMREQARIYLAQQADPHRVTTLEMADHVGVSPSTLQRACRMWGRLVPRGRKRARPPN